MNRLNFLVVLLVGVFLFGCAGVPKEVVEALKKDVGDIEGRITAAEPVLAGIADLDKKAGEKLSAKEIDALLIKVGDAKKFVAGVLGLEPIVAGISDSLAVLAKKATGKIKDEITALTGKVDELGAKVDVFASANAKLDEIKAKLEAAKKPAKPTPTPKAKKPAAKIKPPEKG